MASESRNWGYMLIMPGRPTRLVQERFLRAAGVDMGRFGTWWCDRLDRAKRHRTAGQAQLVERNHLITAAVEGDTVVVADTLCLGVSSQDVRWFGDQLEDIGVSLKVNDPRGRLTSPSTPDQLLAEFDRRLNQFNVAKSRRKKSR